MNTELPRIETVTKTGDEPFHADRENLPHSSSAYSAIRSLNLTMPVDGVVSADVSYEEEQAVIRYRPETTNTAEMIAAIDATGFTASLSE